MKDIAKIIDDILLSIEKLIKAIKNCSKNQGM